MKLPLDNFAVFVNDK